MLTKYRSLRTTSALEASFLHLHSSIHPCSKAVGLRTLHVRLCLWDWTWNTRALQKSGEIPNVQHSWLWLVDQLADVCSESDMFPPGSPLPVSLRDWTRTQTNYKSCTIRGVDWEVVNTRNQCKLNGVQVSELTAEETLKLVLQFPDLVRTNDWVQLEIASGIRTNSYALESMMTRCTNAALEYPHLEACGLGSLKATLRSTAPESPRSTLQSAALVSNLGTPCPLPFPQIAGPPSLVTGTIHQLDMQLVPEVQQEHSVDTQSAPQRNKPGPRGGRSSAERKAEIRKQNPEQYQKELDRNKEKKRESRAHKKQKT
jgi:hypothetical protein